MRIHEILSDKPLFEMSYSRKKAELMVSSLEKPINDHLLKLLVVDDNQNRDHWTNELLEWLDEVAEIRLKSDNKTPPAFFYYRNLYEEPFGGEGVGETNLARRIRRLERQGYALRDVDLNDVLERLRRFHKQFSEACHRGIEVDEISALLSHMTSPAM